MNQTDENQKQLTPNPSYAEKTDRFKTWILLIKYLSILAWAIVVLVVIFPLIGKAFLVNSIGKISDFKQPQQEQIVFINKTLPNPDQIDRAIATGVKTAYTDSKEFATAELDAWLDKLMWRVDHSFLDWYFDYFNQKKIEFSTPFIWLSSSVSHWINPQSLPAEQVVAEKITEKFQTEFTKRVLRPKIAQLELERITRDTINLYINELENNLTQIQASYQIPQGNWERYLDDLAITITDTEGNISNLSMKFVAGGGTYLLAKAMLPVATKIGSKITLSMAGKAGTKIAAKTGGVVAGKLGAQLLDPIVAVGIIIWDVWDYHHTVTIEKPILREAIYDYLQEIKASLLANHQSSIMATIDQVNQEIVQALSKK
jgi:hypothetical protein